MTAASSAMTAAATTCVRERGAVPPERDQTSQQY
jgi:hypothetical protein